MAQWKEVGVEFDGLPISLMDSKWSLLMDSMDSQGSSL